MSNDNERDYRDFNWTPSFLDRLAFLFHGKIRIQNTLTNPDSFVRNKEMEFKKETHLTMGEAKISVTTWQRATVK